VVATAAWDPGAMTGGGLEARPPVGSSVACSGRAAERWDTNGLCASELAVEPERHVEIVPVDASARACVALGDDGTASDRPHAWPDSWLDDGEVSSCDLEWPHVARAGAEAGGGALVAWALLPWGVQGRRMEMP